MKLIMLINVEMPTMVGIVTLIGTLSTASESLKAKKFLIFSIFVLMSF